MAKRQSARVSKTTNDGFIRSGTGYFIAVPIWQQWHQSYTRIKLTRLENATIVVRFINIYDVRWTALY